ncbi:unnamed protein product [Rhodiola kirilowii]
MEIVQKEIQKLLDCGTLSIPYQIANGWSPVHMVPKKSGSQSRKMPKEKW